MEKIMFMFMLGLSAGFVVGYGLGLLMGEWDKRIKNDGR